jgi:hypothetical protein
MSATGPLDVRSGTVDAFSCDMLQREGELPWKRGVNFFNR